MNHKFIGFILGGLGGALAHFAGFSVLQVFAINLLAAGAAIYLSSEG